MWFGSRFETNLSQIAILIDQLPWSERGELLLNMVTTELIGIGVHFSAGWVKLTYHCRGSDRAWNWSDFLIKEHADRVINLTTEQKAALTISW